MNDKVACDKLDILIKFFKDFNDFLVNKEAAMASA